MARGSPREEQTGPVEFLERPEVRIPALSSRRKRPETEHRIAFCQKSCGAPPCFGSSPCDMQLSTYKTTGYELSSLARDWHLFGVRRAVRLTDKSKPTARWGRKARSLESEIVRLPKWKDGQMARRHPDRSSRRMRLVGTSPARPENRDECLGTLPGRDGRDVLRRSIAARADVPFGVLSPGSRLIGRDRAP